MLFDGSLFSSSSESAARPCTIAEATNPDHHCGSMAGLRVEDEGLPVLVADEAALPSTGPCFKEKGSKSEAHGRRL